MHTGRQESWVYSQDLKILLQSWEGSYLLFLAQRLTGVKHTWTYDSQNFLTACGNWNIPTESSSTKCSSPCTYEGFLAAPSCDWHYQTKSPAKWVGFAKGFLHQPAEPPHPCISQCTETTASGAVITWAAVRALWVQWPCVLIHAGICTLLHVPFLQKLMVFNKLDPNLSGRNHVLISVRAK